MMRLLFGKRFFAISLLVLNGFGLWQGLRIWRAHLEAGDGEPVLIRSPQDLEGLAGMEAVHWRWSRPVVAPERVGQTEGLRSVQVDPPVGGQARWISEQELIFTPGEPWPEATSIHFDLQMLSTNAQQRVFALRDLAQVDGPPLDVRSAEPFFVPGRSELQILLRMNAPVEKDALSQHLLLLDPSRNLLEFSVEQTPQPDEFLLSTFWTGTQELTLRVQPGLSPAGNRGAALPSERLFHFKEISRFALTGFEVEQPTFGPGEIELSFSDRPALQSVMDGLRVEPPVALSVGPGTWWREQSCTVSGDFQPGTQYRIRLAEGIRSLNGAVLQEKLDRAFIMPERRPGLKFAHPGWILNAKGAARVEVLTENEGALDLRLQRVHANNLVAFAVRASGEDGWRSQENPERTLSETLLEKRIGDVDNGAFPLDLSDTLRSSGQGVYRIELTGRNSGRRIEKLIALSDVGLLARRNGGELMVWALELGSARPVPDLEIEVWSDTRQRLAQGRTDSEGLCVLTPEKGNALLILGRSHKSLGLLILKGDQPFPDLNGSRPFLSDGNEAFLYTGRGMYRPEETVQFRGIVRGKDFALPGRFPVELRMHDAAGLTVWRERRELSEWGTVEASVALQPEWPNGTYRITLSLPGDDAPLWGETSFHLESFAPPQVVVKAFTPQGEEAVPDLFTVEVDAQMLYGAPASSHSGKSTLTLIPETFRSSEYPDHHFSDSRKAGFGSWSRPLRDFVTNEQGQAQVQVRIPGDKTAPSALRAVVGISVTEFSGREASCFVSRRVDTVPYYLGLRIQSPQPGGHAEVNVVGVLPGGEKMQADVELDAAWYRVNTQQGIRRNANGRYTWFSEEVDVLEGESKIRMEAGECSFQVPLLAEGRYRIAVRDPGTGFSCSQTVSVGDWAQAPERADRIGMRLDRDRYEPGTEATLTLNTPFSGRLLLTLESERVQMRQTLWVDAPQKTIKLQVPETDAAHLWIRATLIRPQPDSGQAPVLRSEGALPLWIHREDLHAPLELEVAEQLRPSTQVELLLRGEPGAEVVVSGVDDGILQLSDFQTPDPLSWFLMLRRAVSLSWDSYDDLMPELGSGLFAGDAEMGGGMAAAIGKRLNPVDAKRFRPLSWWSGAQRIPESGVLRLKMSMPEFSGRVRWMAVQVAGRGMGHAEAFSKVGREVIVQQSAPLFMAPGDRSVWSVRLHNRGDSVRTVVLKPTVRGPVELRESGEILQLGAGESLQRNFSIHAAEKIGKAELVMGVQVEDEFWQDLIELAVRPGEAFEERTLRRVLAPGQVINIDAGGEMLAGTGSRTLNLQSMPVLQLESARSYLMRYPYGCLEQTVSAAAPALYLGEWTEDAGAGADQILRAGVQELWKKQKRDGSFGYWHAGDQSSVAGSLGALMFLQEAESKGVEVDERSLRAGLNWARGWLIRQQWDPEASDKNLQITRACKVLAMAGELDTGWMQRLRERKEDLGGYARIVAAESLMLGGRRALGLELLEGLNRVDRGWGWQSSRAGNAELLWILLRLDPEDGRIPELLKSLLADRNPEGHWGQTFENAQVIRALVEYAKVWPSGEEGLQAVWSGRGTRTFQGPGRMPLAEEESGTLRNSGTSPIYLEIRSAGVPQEPTPRANTFQLERSLLRLDGQAVSAETPLIRGEDLVLRFRISGLPGRVEYLALDQRLPAGLEPLPASRQAQSLSSLPKSITKRAHKPRHLEIRDDRILIFPGEIGPGETIFLVRVRAVTPGAYRFPAVTAQDMYAHDLFCRGPESSIEVIP